MKHLYKLLLTSFLCLSWGQLMAQDVRVESFEELSIDGIDFIGNYKMHTDLRKECAILYILANASIRKMKIEAELGYKKLDRVDNTIFVYVPIETKSIILQYDDGVPVYYKLPISLTANKVYKGSVQISVNKEADKKSSSYMSSNLMIEEFAANPMNLLARANPVVDNSGQPCAVIRYTVDSDEYTIEPNLGVLKTITNPGEIIQYVPRWTKRLTIRYRDLIMVRNYEIPVEIEPNVTYDCKLSLSESFVNRQKASPDNDVYLGVGYSGSLSFSKEGGEQSISIHCNSEWETSAPSWCRLSETSGSGNVEIKVNIRNNSTGKNRKGTISVVSHNVTTNIEIAQDSF